MFENTTQEDRMLDFLKKNTLARPKELQTIGVAATTIARAVKEGSVTRIGRGLYQLSDNETNINTTLAEISKQSPRVVICLISALAFHGLTDQIPRKTWIAIGINHWKPQFEQTKTRVVRLREPYFSGDIEKHSISGAMVQIYSVEKSLCDAFRHPKLVDRSVAIECLKSALTDKKTTPAKIANTAKKYRAWNQINQYLEALTSNG